MWGVPRIQRQFSDFVNEIVDEVFATLYKNDCQALRGFVARDNERMFLAWLGTICERTANRSIRSLIRVRLLDEEHEELHDSLRSLDSNERWELYETIVAELRGFSKRKSERRERDIHIFQLYVWADFSEPMIETHPFLKNLGARIVDNVVNRMREYLRRRRNFLE
jgi:hypothetical protein